MGQVFGCLLPMWETWMQFQAPSFGFAQSCLLQAFGE